MANTHTVCIPQQNDWEHLKVEVVGIVLHFDSMSRVVYD